MTGSHDKITGRRWRARPRRVTSTLAIKWWKFYSRERSARRTKWYNFSCFPYVRHTRIQELIRRQLLYNRQVQFSRYIYIYIHTHIRFQLDLNVANIARHKFFRREREEKSGESKPNNDVTLLPLHSLRVLDNFSIYRSFVHTIMLDSERIPESISVRRFAEYKMRRALYL